MSEKCRGNVGEMSGKCEGKCMPMHAFAKIQWYIFKKFRLRLAFYFYTNFDVTNMGMDIQYFSTC